MPCYDSRTSCDANECQKKRDQLTQMLCWICGRIEIGGGLDFLSPEIRDWWEDHKKADQEQDPS